MTGVASASDFVAGGMSAGEAEIWRRVQHCTMTSAARVLAAIRAVDYIASCAIPGDIVECGVWRGGSMMAMALALIRRGDVSRRLMLYDTFTGMTPPSERDVQFDGWLAADVLARADRTADVWGIASLDEVRTNVTSTGYPAERITFIPGPVQETLPATLPDAVAILRLDTDWYESTRHELVHLYPLLSDGGVLIVDDYGHWRGAREATDQYFAQDPHAPQLLPIDYTGVLAVKNRR